MADGFRGYDTWKCRADRDESPDPAEDRDGPGTVKHYQGHAQCLARINKLTAVLEEIAAICDGRDDADLVGDPPCYVPNIWMQIHTRIREVVPR
jgi:hypothetical protein